MVNDGPYVLSLSGLTPCQMDYVKKTATPLVGAVIPRCSRDGSYAPEQCHGSTGTCWCVDRQGQQIGEKVMGDPKCGMVQF